MMNRRVLLTTLGGAAGGMLGRAQPLLGQPTPTPTRTVPNGCKPNPPESPGTPGSLSLQKLGVYASPLNSGDAYDKLERSFLAGVQRKDSTLTIKQKVAAHLVAGYSEAVESRFIEGIFNPTGTKLAAQWIVAIDHAYILGQLAVYYRKPDTNGKYDQVKVRDVVRAQARFHAATSSDQCDCYINEKHAYELPSAMPPDTVAGKPGPTEGKCTGPIASASGQIDEECPFCD